MQGAWTLHRVTQEMVLDFFVCFSSVAFDYPNIEALAGHLLQRLLPVGQAEQARAASKLPTEPAADARLARDHVEVQQMSDQQVAALIDAELESLTDKG